MTGYVAVSLKFQPHTQYGTAHKGRFPWPSHSASVLVDRKQNSHLVQSSFHLFDDKSLRILLFAFGYLHHHLPRAALPIEASCC